MGNNEIIKNNNVFICDFLLSIGKHCRPAIQLRENSLRYFSSPLDWIGGYTLDILLKLYKNNFENYFKNFKIDYDKKAATDSIWVEDTYYNIFDMHHFKKNINIDEYLPEYRSMMKKRADRLKNYFKTSTDVVLVAERNENKEEMIDYLNSFSKIYPNLNIRLFNVRDDRNMDFKSYNENIIFDDSKLSYIEYIFNDTNEGEETTSGNNLVWKNVLSKYKLRKSKN